MSKNTNMSPFDIRYSLVDSLINMPEDNRASVIKDAGAIEKLVEEFNALISTNKPPKAQSHAENMYAKFLKSTPSSFTEKDWHFNEFAQLCDTRRITPCYFKLATFARQSGVSTFLHQYTEFMNSVSPLKVVLITDADIGTNDLKPDFVNRLRGMSISQILIDSNSARITGKQTYDMSPQEWYTAIKDILPQIASNDDTTGMPIAIYQTVE